MDDGCSIGPVFLGSCDGRHGNGSDSGMARIYWSSHAPGVQTGHEFRFEPPTDRSSSQLRWSQALMRGSNELGKEPLALMRVCPLSRQRDRKSTSELQSLMRLSYAVFCLKQKKQIIQHNQNRQN